MKEQKRELTDELLQEFQEVQRLVDNEEGVPYWSWTKSCAAYLTIYCC